MPQSVKTACMEALRRLNKAVPLNLITTACKELTLYNLRDPNAAAVCHAQNGLSALLVWPHQLDCNTKSKHMLLPDL